MTIEPYDHHLELAAAMPCANEADLVSAGLSSALSYLEPGETLRLALCTKPNAAVREQVAIRVEASRKARKNSSCNQSAAMGLRFASPALQFAAIDELNLETHFPYRWELHEPADTHSNRPIGFRSDHDNRANDLFFFRDEIRGSAGGDRSHATTWKTIDDCMLALVTAGSTSEIRFVWTAREVPSDVLHAGCDRRRLGPRIGLHLAVSVHSNVPLPTNLLRAIGQLAFQAEEVSVSQVERDTGEISQSNGEKALILRLPDAVPPAILPSPEFLIGAGITKRFPEAPAGLPSEGTLVGTAYLRGVEQEVMIPDRERSRHAYLVGSTGTGKSTMLLEMIRGDIRKGEGLLLIDPHGDLYEAVKAEFPWDRRGDLVLLDASNRKHPFPLNVLSVDGLENAQASTFITNEFLAIFASLYDMKTCGGPMFELYFTNAMSLIMNSQLEFPTLSDLARIFEDSKFRRECLETCTDEIAVRFWKNTAMQTSGDASLVNISPYIFSKVNRFVQDASLKPILASKEPGINFREAIDQNKVVLVNLAKGQIGAHSARFLGMAIMMRLLAATLGRGDVPEHKRQPFFVHIDEFQSLATGSAATFLAEARKYNVCLTLASQTLSQLSVGGENLADTVVANCGSMIMTRLGPQDADRLSRTYGPTISPAEMQSLPAFHAVGRFLARDIPPPPFVFNVPKPRQIASQRDRGVHAENDDYPVSGEVASKNNCEEKGKPALRSEVDAQGRSRRRSLLKDAA